MSNIIEITNENNQKEKIKVLKYFKLKNKEYIIYKNIGVFSKKEVYAAEINESEDEISLLPIEDKEVLKTINEIMESMYGHN